MKVACPCQESPCRTGLSWALLVLMLSQCDWIVHHHWNRMSQHHVSREKPYKSINSSIPVLALAKQVAHISMARQMSASSMSPGKAQGTHSIWLLRCLLCPFLQIANEQESSKSKMNNLHRFRMEQGQRTNLLQSMPRIGNWRNRSCTWTSVSVSGVVLIQYSFGL